MIVALLALLAAAVVPYLRSWGFDFVYLDDHQFVVDGAWFFRDWANVPHAFTHDVWEFFGEESSLYRPLLLLPRFVEVWLFGTSPGPYHVLNTALHFGATALFFALLRALMGEVKAPLVWAVVFAVHPALVPAVAWIEGYNNSMLAALVLASLVLTIRAVQTGRRGQALASAVAFFMALLTKENAVCTPVLCAGICALYTRRRGDMLARHPVLGWVIGSWSLALLAWFFVRWNAIPTTPELELGYIAASVARNSPGLLLYWGKVFLPFNLTPLPVLADSSLAPGLVATALYAALFARSSREHRAVLAYGVVWFALLIGPSLLISRNATLTGSIFREDRLYQASLGPLLALALVSRRALERHPGPALRAAAAVVAASLCLGQLFMGRYADGITFYTAATSGSPHLAFAHTHLAGRYFEREDFAGARREFERALALNPLCPQLHNNYALLLMHDGELDLADQHLRAEIAANPRFSKAHYNRGLLLGRRGDFSAAAESFERYLASQPRDADAVLMSRLALVDCYRRLERPEQAERVARDLEASGATVMPPQ